MAIKATREYRYYLMRADKSRKWRMVAEGRTQKFQMVGCLMPSLFCPKLYKLTNWVGTRCLKLAEPTCAIPERPTPLELKDKLDRGGHVRYIEVSRKDSVAELNENSIRYLRSLHFIDIQGQTHYLGNLINYCCTN